MLFALAIILLTTEMAQAAPTTLTTTPMVPRLSETLQFCVQFTRGSLVSLQTSTMTRRQPRPPTSNPSTALMLRPSTPSLQPVPLCSLAGIRLTRNNAHVLLTPLALETSQNFLLQKIHQKICVIMPAFFEPGNEGKI